MCAYARREGAMENFLKLLVLVAEYGVTCCGEVMLYSVCRSAAGYYLGHFCPNCGPWDRLSCYYPTREEAEDALRHELEGCLAYYN